MTVQGADVMGKATTRMCSIEGTKSNAQAENVPAGKKRRGTTGGHDQSRTRKLDHGKSRTRMSSIEGTKSNAQAENMPVGKKTRGTTGGHAQSRTRKLDHERIHRMGMSSPPPEAFWAQSWLSAGPTECKIACL